MKLKMFLISPPLFGISLIRQPRRLNDAIREDLPNFNTSTSNTSHSFLMFLRRITSSPSKWRLHRSTVTVSRDISSHLNPRFPTVKICPSPTCTCAETPAMPEGLEIDHKKNLNGTMPVYAEQVLICTGKDDWTSRIEEENSGDNLAADIKELIGRGGVYSDVRIRPVLSLSYQPTSRTGC